jgi:methionyl-tRNA formyltransferase
MKPIAIFTGWQGNQASFAVQKLISQHFRMAHARFYDFGDTEDWQTLARIEPDYLFSFGPLIVREPLLSAVKMAAINFHTAPPAYPGRGGCSYALYNQDKEYGVTAHLMTDKIDDGPIMDVLRFPIPQGCTAGHLHNLAMAKIPVLAEQVIGQINSTIGLKPCPDEQWGGPAKTQDDLLDFMKLTTNTSEAVLRRKLDALRYPGKKGPYLMYRGMKFWYIEGES